MQLYLAGLQKCGPLFEVFIAGFTSMNPTLFLSPQFKKSNYQWQLSPHQFGNSGIKVAHTIKSAFIDGQDINPDRVVWDEEFDLIPKIPETVFSPEPFGWGLNYLVHHYHKGRKGNVFHEITAFPNSSFGANRLKLALANLNSDSPVITLPQRQPLISAA